MSTPDPFHFTFDVRPDDPPEGERWSSYDGATHGPSPQPAWVITDLAAVEADLGILKSGKEADVHLIRRWLPSDPEADAGAHPAPVATRENLLAAKRFRTSHHRLFHRDAGYLEGRRVAESREMRALVGRTRYGRDVIARQWAGAEFQALAMLWSHGLPVPYPVQLTSGEMLMEFIGTDGVAAPRLASTRPRPGEVADLAEQARDIVVALAAMGYAHGDLSAYNVLLHDGRLVVIDWPQIVDIIANPQGFDYLRRDVENLFGWFTRKGADLDLEHVFGDAAAAATSHW
ncbi:MAG: RIO1 family regulatory kinase/ATPase [Dermatophilaceae bacterium]